MAEKIKKSMKQDVHIWRLIVIMLVWFVFIGITKGSKFYTVVNFQTMFAQFPEFGLMSLGVMVCMITGGIDLSTLGVANVTSITVALVMRSLANESGELAVAMIPVVFLLAILMGVAAGTINGILVA